MNDKPKIFVVTRTPKGLDNLLSVQPDVAASFYCAVINVSDSPCATFDYQMKIPSFWFPVHEVAYWGYPPFFGTMKVVNQYYKGDKPVLIHCHAGANRSPSIAYAILLAKGYSPQEAEESLQYPNLSLVFKRNIKNKHIPENIINFLKKSDEPVHSPTSMNSVLKNMDDEYSVWAEQKYESQSDCVISADAETKVHLVYNSEKKKFIVVNDEPTPPSLPPSSGPWIDPVFKSKEWYMTPIKPTT
jgi:hypothetical protein